MKIIIDCMGGDKAPLEIIKGTVDARRELGGEYLLVGNETVIRTLAAEHHLDIDGMDILHAESVITMEDDAMAPVKTKKDSSMAMGLRALSEGAGQAFVSCGNTGALFSGATLIVRRIKGVHRAAIAALLPFAPPVLMLDAGANVVVRPEFLPQFAAMGAAYMKSLFGMESPRVGLLNNGAEESKGTPLQTEAYALLQADTGINFVGNVEGNTVMQDTCDVLVTDGFTGNIMLKSMEGIGKLIMKRMKHVFYATPVTKLAALTVKKPLGEMKKDFDVSEHGGSPILGLRKPVIKAHGSSDARAFKNAIRQAIRFAESSAITDIEAYLATVTVGTATADGASSAGGAEA